MSTITTTRLFVTDHMTPAEADTLVKLALPLMAENGRIPWSKVEAATGIGYSRGWLIVRRAYLEQNHPNLLVDAQGLMATALKQAQDAGTEGEFASHEGGELKNVTNGERRILSPIVHKLREDTSISWGEIAVRLGMPESKVRKLFRASGAKKDLGLRINKGGRFAYSDPTLYLENRKAEGAQIPVDLKGRPKAEQLLNFQADEAPVKKVNRARTPKAAPTTTKGTKVAKTA